MKTRNILIVSLVVVLTIGGAFSVFAFGKKSFGRGRMPFGGPGMFSAEALIERFSDELELTEEQKAQLQPLVEEKMSQMREHFSSKRHEFQKEGQKMWQDAEAQLAEILTEEQMQKLREMKESRMEHGFHPGFKGRGGHFQELMSELQLSQDQRDEIFTIFGKYKETRQKGMQNFLDIHTAMSDILLQEDFDEQKVRELFQQQAPQLEERFVEHAQMLAEIKTVLTPEQIETLQEKNADLIGTFQRWHGKNL